MGSAGGIIAELSLLSCYVLPIAIASVAGGNYTAEMVLIAACYALAAVPVVFLPKAIGATPDAADAAPSAAGNKSLHVFGAKVANVTSIFLTNHGAQSQMMKTDKDRAFVHVLTLVGFQKSLAG